VRLSRPAGVALAAVLLGSCSPVEEPVKGPVAGPPAPVERYVALGDSFTAAPLVPTTDLADGCFRSDSNYPSIVAERLGVAEFVDVSCSGASTRDLNARQQTVRGASVPPQLRALDRDTDLVTLGIGGNDFDLFHTLVATCTRTGRMDPTGTPCADRLQRRGVDLVARTTRIGNRVAQAIRRVRRRAPEATIVVVGYLRLAPPTGRCRDLPFARGDYGYGAEVSAALNDALSAAARRTGVAFVDMHAASEGHDVCSDEPWVNGHRTVRGAALAYHPLGEGMEAVADQVLATVRSRAPIR
jgi:lysophospholipase L1-like esterase